MEKKSEVLEMLDDLFDKELYENDLKQTAFEEGEQIGLEKGEQNKLISLVQKKLQKGDSIEKIADDLVEDVEIIKEIVDELRLQ